MQVVVGDQLTCRNIRSSKLWRQVEVMHKDKLTWANEMAGSYAVDIYTISVFDVHKHVAFYLR